MNAISDMYTPLSLVKLAGYPICGLCNYSGVIIDWSAYINAILYLAVICCS